MHNERRVAQARVTTPCYLIRESRLLRNLERIQRVREASGVRMLLALKCFAVWPLFPLLRRHLDGVTTSSLNEVRLGRERFGGEVHAYSVAWSRPELRRVRTLADTVIFNSAVQLEMLADAVRGRPLGLRVNPGLSCAAHDLADPARPQSRLGATDPADLERVLPRLEGVMFHFNCENESFAAFDRALGRIERRYARALARLRWVSLGGGLAFTGDGYPRAALARRLRQFAARHGVQVYLEPGEAVVTGAAELRATVLDIVRNGREIAIVDASAEAHLPDLLLYDAPARIRGPGRRGRHRTLVAGRSCLAGDIFGETATARPLRVGDVVAIEDAGGYSMVQNTWFNGLPLPAIVVERRDGRQETLRRFDYEDFVQKLG